MLKINFKFKPADILFTRGTGPISKTIRWKTRDKFNHVSIVDGCTYNRVTVTEALNPYVDTNDFLAQIDNHKVDAFVVYRNLFLTDEIRNALLISVAQCRGIPYDNNALWNWIIGHTWFGTNTKVYCSELIYTELKEHKQIKTEFPREKISPKNLRLDVLEKEKRYLKIYSWNREKGCILQP